MAQLFWSIVMCCFHVIAQWLFHRGQVSAWLVLAIATVGTLKFFAILTDWSWLSWVFTGFITGIAIAYGLGWSKRFWRWIHNH